MVVGVVYRVSEKESDTYTLFRLDREEKTTNLGPFKTLREAIDLAENDARALT